MNLLVRGPYIDWITTEHTGVDVPIYAFGPKSKLFSRTFS